MISSEGLVRYVKKVRMVSCSVCDAVFQGWWGACGKAAGIKCLEVLRVEIYM